jgi:hypothetical protein
VGLGSVNLMSYHSHEYVTYGKTQIILGGPGLIK